MAGYQRQAAANIQPDLPINAEDLNLEFDALAAAFHNSTGHPHDGSAGGGPKISLTSSVSGILPIAQGGTGGSTQASARNSLGLGTLSILSPTGTANNTTYLRGDGTWAVITIPPVPVTSVAGKVGDVTLVKVDVGLGNVDNTSDLNKPISTATQSALNSKTDVDAQTISSKVTSTQNARLIFKDISDNIRALFSLDRLTNAWSVITRHPTNGDINKLEMSGDTPGVMTLNGIQVAVGVGSMAYRNVTISTADPSGGVNGDFWAQVE